MFAKVSRRRLPVLLVLPLVLVGCLTLVATRASAQTPPTPSSAEAPGRGRVEVVKASGLLDSVLVDFIEKRIAAASADRLTAVVIQLNSRGATVSDERLVELARKMHRSPVPVAVWVGPSGAQAQGAAAQLVGVARPGGLAAGAKIGKAGTQILPAAEFGTPWGALANRLQSGFVRNSNADRATLKQLGVVDAAVLVDFVGDLEGVAVRDVPATNGTTQREPNADVRFTSLTLTGQLMHTVASPSVAYLLFVIGLGLIIFELYTAGIGIAGVVGAVCVALGCYGLVALPVRWWAVALLVLAFAAFAIDVQTGVPRFWTGVGFLLFLVGTVLLFERFSPSWITWLVAFVGVVLTFVSGMPAMVRTRFSTPTIGREWMIGEMGLAISGINPDGTVSVRSARWPARTNRATPISAGDRVRVVGIEGIVLEVEPETGGAKDYRERRRGDGSPREGARES